MNFGSICPTRPGVWLSISMLLLLGTISARPGTRLWTGASVSSGNWTTAANWQGNGSLEGSGKVLLGSGALQAGGNHSSTVFSGTIDGTGTFAKSGTGILTLTGTNSYSGVTSNLNGTLLVHGALTASVSVQVHPGSVLGGNGQVQTISVVGNGAVQPGASPGNLSATSVQLASGILGIELNGLAPGIQHDRLTASGPVTLGGSLQVAPGFQPGNGDTFIILEKTSPGPVNGTFNSLPEGAVFLADGLQFQITYAGGDGNDVVLKRIGAVASNITGISQVGDGQMRIIGQGEPSATYVLEVATTLVPPILWTAIATNSANGLGVFEFTEGNVEGGTPSLPARFYRVKTP